jgi:hypothetical protein
MPGVSHDHPGPIDGHNCAISRDSKTRDTSAMWRDKWRFTASEG